MHPLSRVNKTNDIKHNECMERMVLFSLLAVLFSFCQARELLPVAQNRPDRKREIPLVQALAGRQFAGESGKKAQTRQELADPVMGRLPCQPQGAGKRTAPAAADRQETGVCVRLPGATCGYDAKVRMFQPVVKEDLGPALAGPQVFAAQTPASGRRSSGCNGSGKTKNSLEIN